MKVGICRIDEDGNIVELKREYYGQGMIFKDEDAFENEPDAPCYVPELSDAVYTRNDFLKMCNDQPEIADQVFDAVDWQHPETYLDEQYREGELDVCEQCGKIFESYGAEKCPYCGADYEGGDE